MSRRWNVCFYQEVKIIVKLYGGRKSHFVFKSPEFHVIKTFFQIESLNNAFKTFDLLIKVVFTKFFRISKV
jgi:hypothetical protein